MFAYTLVRRNNKKIKKVMQMRTFLIGLSIFFVSCSHTEQKQNTAVQPDSLQKENEKFRTYTWDDELCHYTCKYDSTLVTSIQLKNSYDLGYHTDRFEITTQRSAFSFNDIEKLNVDSLDNEFKRKINDLQTIEVINSNYWHNLKQQKIIELKKLHKLYRLHILGYQYPDTLNFKGCPNECDKYITGLVKGGDELLKVWVELHNELISQQRKIGASNKTIEFLNKKFDEKYNSFDKLEYARMDVISFGWWNKVNHTISRVNTDNFQNEYRKNFTEIKEECDEP